MNKLVLSMIAVAVLLAGCDDLVCGSGTHQVGERCVPRYEETLCGAGTVNVNGECVPEDEAEDPVECGEGTVEVDGECVPEDELECGEGTVEVDGECVDEESECGPGTVAGGPMAATSTGGSCPSFSPDTCWATPT